MTLFKPTLRVNRLVVFRDTRVAFETNFHPGVNIVRGQNSSGKTTVLDLLAYSLGAEFIPWKPPADLCTETIAEVLLNGKAVTLRRRISSSPMNPLQIYWGPVDTALKAGIHDWEEYPFRRSTSKISFTQALLLALEMPEAKGDGASNLTMHQFLRVLYADQPSLHSPIFRVDSFDNALTRETVGGYLCGVYNDHLYSAQLEKREIEKALSQLESELRSIYSVLGKSGRGADMEWLAQRIRSAEADKAGLEKELSRLKSERTTGTSTQKQEVATRELRRALSGAKEKLAGALDRLATLELEIEDSRQFIQELENRLKNLDESKATRRYFGSVTFAFCPSCLSELKPLDDAAQCSLCKKPIEHQAADAQILRMQNELSIQKRESLRLMTDRQEAVKALRHELPTLKSRLNTLEEEYSRTSAVWSSDLELAVESTARRIGEIDQEIRNLYELQKLAAAIADLQKECEALAAQLAALDVRIESMIHEQEVRKGKVTATIADVLSRLLREDLPRQKEFSEAQNVTFSFSENVVSVNGSTQFSESSTVVLRHLFHLALLSAATQFEFMRMPRFLMLDGIEDGGMELERSHHLQEIIVNECSKFASDFQLIFATSQIAPALDIEKFVVGRSFTKDEKSIAILQ